VLYIFNLYFCAFILLLIVFALLLRACFFGINKVDIYAKFKFALSYLEQLQIPNILRITSPDVRELIAGGRGGISCSA